MELVRLIEAVVAYEFSAAVEAYTEEVYELCRVFFAKELIVGSGLIRNGINLPRTGEGFSLRGFVE